LKESGQDVLDQAYFTVGAKMVENGMVGSLDTATLLVAGAQANMGLWSLALIGIVGAGAAIIYKAKSYKTDKETL